MAKTTCKTMAKHYRQSIRHLQLCLEKAELDMKFWFDMRHVWRNYGDDDSESLCRDEAWAYCRTRFLKAKRYYKWASKRLAHYAIKITACYVR